MVIFLQKSSSKLDQEEAWSREFTIAHCVIFTVVCGLSVILTVYCEIEVGPTNRYYYCQKKAERILYAILAAIALFDVVLLIICLVVSIAAFAELKSKDLLTLVILEAVLICLMIPSALLNLAIARRNQWYTQIPSSESTAMLI